MDNMLLKVFCSLFSAVAVFSRLLSNEIDKRIHGNYRVKTHNGKCSAWYMKMIWKVQYSLLMPKCTGLCDGTTRLHLYVTVLLTFYIVKKQQIFSSLSFYKYYYLLPLIYAPCISDLLEKSNFVLDFVFEKGEPV